MPRAVQRALMVVAVALAWPTSPVLADEQGPTVVEPRVTTTATKATVVFGLFDPDDGNLRYQVLWCERQASSDCVTFRRRAARAAAAAGEWQSTPEATYVQDGRDETVVLDNLKPSTTYVWYVQARDGHDNYGFSNSSATFTTQAPPSEPAATTGNASGVSSTAATLEGTAFVPSGASGTAVFEYGTAPSLGSTAGSTTLSAGERSVGATLSGLTPNTTYRYRLKVTTSDGKTAVGATATFTTDPPPDSCPSPTRRQTYRFQAVRASGCLLVSGSRFVARGDVLFNGLTIAPSGGTARESQTLTGCSGECAQLQALLDDPSRPTLFYDGAGGRLGTTQPYTVDAGTALRLRNGVIDESLADASGTRQMFAVGAPPGFKVLGFPALGFIGFTPRGDSGGAVDVELGIPFLDGVSGGTTLTVSPSGTVDFDGLSLDVGNAAYKVFDLGELSLRYSKSQSLWAGSAVVTLPVPQQVKVGVNVKVAGGALRELGGSVDNLNRYLAQGLFLQKIGLNTQFSPFGFTGTVGLSAGPKVLGAEILGIEGSYAYLPARREQALTGVTWTGGGLPKLTYAPTDAPPSVQIGGRMSLATIPLAEASARFYFASFPWITGSGKAGLQLKAGDTVIAGGTLNAGFSVYNRFFAADGSARVTVLGYDLASAYALLTSAGGYGCGGVGELKLGFSFRWDQEPRAMWGCSTTTSAIGATAQAAAARRFTVPRGAGQTVLRFLGRGGDPEIRLRGPDGTKVTMPPAGQPMRVRAGVLVARDPSADQTVVQLRSPAPGVWTYELLAGSAPVRAVRAERVLAEPRVQAVVGGRGDRRVLRWKLDIADGERVRFVEAGGGVPPRPILTTAKGSGAFRFVPALVPSEDHVVEAYVIRPDGLVRARLTVARFSAPTPRLVTPRPVRIARGPGDTATVRWRASSGATRYDVLVKRRGETSLVRAPGALLKLGDLGKADGVTVSVRAVGADGRRGPEANATLVAGEDPGKPDAPSNPPASPRPPAQPPATSLRLSGRTLAGGRLTISLRPASRTLRSVRLRGALNCVGGGSVAFDRKFRIARHARVQRYTDSRGVVHFSYVAETRDGRFRIAGRFRARGRSVRGHGTLVLSQGVGGRYCESGVLGWGAATS